MKFIAGEFSYEELAASKMTKCKTKPFFNIAVLTWQPILFRGVSERTIPSVYRFILLTMSQQRIQAMSHG